MVEFPGSFVGAVTYHSANWDCQIIVNFMSSPHGRSSNCQTSDRWTNGVRDQNFAAPPQTWWYFISRDHGFSKQRFQHYHRHAGTNPISHTFAYVWQLRNIRMHASKRGVTLLYQYKASSIVLASYPTSTIPCGRIEHTSLILGQG